MSLQNDFSEFLRRINFVNIISRWPDRDELTEMVYKFQEDLGKLHTLTNFMIPKRSLIKNHYYAGKCRNAYIAKWDGEKFKFSNVYFENIDYWEPGHFYDEFIPLFDIGPELPKEIK